MEQNTSDNNLWLKRLWGTLPFIILFLIIFGLGSAVGTKKKKLEAEKANALKQEQPGINIVTMELIPANIKESLSLPGKIEAWVKLDVLTEVQGQVLDKLVKEGDDVTKGDVIAKLDSRDYENSLNGAKASYHAAIASQKRLKGLYQEKLATQSQLDEATAMVENYKAAMNNAELNLERSTISAPISGKINKIYFEKGQYLGVNVPVVEILQMDKVKVKVGIPESDADVVKRIEQFNVKIDALNYKTFSGHKYSFSNTADQMAHLYDLNITINNPEGEILPDMFARVEIIKSVSENTIVIPMFSIITLDGKKIVYIEKDGMAHSKEVETGLQEGWQIEVTKGLEHSEQVIVVGQRDVSDNQKVTVVRTIKNIEELDK